MSPGLSLCELSELFVWLSIASWSFSLDTHTTQVCARKYLPRGQRGQRGQRALRQVSKDYSLRISVFLDCPTSFRYLCLSTYQSCLFSSVRPLTCELPPAQRPTHLFSSLREHSTIAPVVQSFIILSSFLVFYSRKVNLIPDNPSIDKSENSQNVFLIFSENHGALAPVSTIANYHKLGSLKWQLFSHSSGSQSQKSRCWQAVFLTEVLEESPLSASPRFCWLWALLHVCLHHMGKALKTRFHSNPWFQTIKIKSQKDEVDIRLGKQAKCTDFQTSPSETLR